VRRGTAKDALSRLRWKEKLTDWSMVTLTIRHHGAPNDEKRIVGSRITALGASFFEIDHETQIPYHRILRIDASGRSIYERRLSTPSSKNP
jgi:uncharacterized protein (UPF0248 family)